MMLWAMIIQYYFVARQYIPKFALLISKDEEDHPYV
ncbi:hypothetical protein PMI13_03521 [Chryseobacterium populi]|uniref:Uncharacterized protein n=1 Tax=Chryseobacterium populi TaxID=1144316 RepID=J2JLD5_9FLAO|nr:hypothetical protein PMI13_03521 [Chryseobacterium populi]